MANKDRNKRSARKARAEERAKREAQLAAQPASSSNAAQAKADTKAKASKKAEKDKKPGFFRRIRNWFGDVRTEMHKVVWPSKEELKSYTVAIIAMLIVFGVVIWLVDTGIVAIIAGFTGLRG